MPWQIPSRLSNKGLLLLRTGATHAHHNIVQQTHAYVSAREVSQRCICDHCSSTTRCNADTTSSGPQPQRRAPGRGFSGKVYSKCRPGSEPVPGKAPVAGRPRGAASGTRKHSIDTRSTYLSVLSVSKNNCYSSSGLLVVAAGALSSATALPRNGCSKASHTRACHGQDLNCESPGWLPALATMAADTRPVLCSVWTTEQPSFGQ